MMFMQPQGKLQHFNQRSFPLSYDPPVGSDPVATILAQQEAAKRISGFTPQMGQPSTASQPAEPYFVGAGGRRLSLQDITDQRKRASAMMAGGSDYSPVQHWTQGLARVSQAILGALGEKQADKDAKAYQMQQQGDLAALSQGQNGFSPAVLAALTGGDEVAQRLAMNQIDRANPKPVQPHYWETNNGSLFSVGPDGTPSEVYHDPTPKMNFISDGAGGGNWVAVPTTMDASTAPPAAPAPAIGAIIPDPRKGGGVGNGTGGFR